ncbi:MAG: CHASE2 domain-containing protein, partial [Desulfopila sp.]|nr:CHASE2 domain-containing protein [Desulfopila sp.]
DIYNASGILCNEERLRSSTHLSGFINTLDDEDGVLRRIPLLISYEGALYPGLALATLMHALQTDTISVQREKFGLSVNVAGHRLPVAKDGTILLPFSGPAGTYPYISAVDILTGSVPPGLLHDKIVFVGSSAAGLYDFHHTVFDPNYPGVEILAVAAGGILEGTIRGKPTRHKEFSAVLSLLTAIAVILLFVAANRPVQTIIGIVILLLVILTGGFAVFSVARISLSLGAPFLTACILFTFFSVVRYGMERRMSYLWFEKMARSQQVTLETMAMVVETRDYETGGHIRRTQHFVKMIAMQLSLSGHYNHILTPEYIELLFVSAPLHDIGKVGIPDYILLKPGPLDREEFEKMKRHTDYGRHILINSGKRLESDNFLELACEIAESHHEKWDGSGYPLGLAGEDIPLSGRIMMVADVYDALTSKRCYKSAYSHEKAFQILKAGRGTFFDPLILDAFLQLEKDIITIRERILD